MAEKYRPSNATEGDAFICAWCLDCARDKDQNCPILAATFMLDVEDPQYPREWTFDGFGLPQCSAYVPLDEPLPTPRCERTVDMFGEQFEPGPCDETKPDRMASMIEHGMSGIDWSDWCATD